MTEMLMAAAADGGIDRTKLVALIGAGLVAVWLRHQWHLRRYPERLKCKTCGGSGKVTSTDLLHRTVRGTCPKCSGDAWTDRGAL